MRYDYVVILKRDNARKTDLVSFVMLLCSVCAFILVQIQRPLNIFFCIAIAVQIIGLIINLLGLKKGEVLQFRIWLFVAGGCWIGMPFLQWLVIPFFLLALLEAQSKHPLEIGFAADRIVINTFIKKKFPWNALQSVILKEGMLTLDFRNNTIIQREVIDEDEPEADEDEFNDYCRAKLVNLP